MLIALSAVIFYGCSQENSEGVTANKKISLTIKASELMTRTSFGEKNENIYPGNWTDKEAAKVYMSYTTGSQTVDGSVSTLDQKHAYIQADMDAVEGSDFTYYAVVPATNYVGFDAATGVEFQVPTTQSPEAASYDPAASTLIGKSTIYATQQGTVTSNKQSAEVDMTFDYAVAYGKMAITNLITGQDEGVVSVTLSATDVNIAGKAKFLNGNITVSEGTKEITITTAALSNIWFTSLPAVLEDGKWKLTVSTSAGTYERTISGTSKSLTLTKGVVAEFSVDMTGVVCQPHPITPYTKTINADGCSFGNDGGIRLENGYIKGLNAWRDGYIKAVFADVPQAGTYTLKTELEIWENEEFSFGLIVNNGEITEKIVPPTKVNEPFTYECSVVLHKGSNELTIKGKSYAHDGFTPNFKSFTVTNQKEDKGNFPGEGAEGVDQGVF